MNIDNDIAEKILELAGKPANISEITQTDIKKALINIEQKLNFFSTTTLMHANDKFNVLIVDDLELSIFQFTQLLKRMGTTPNVARNKEEALAEIKKKKFDFIVTDLYLPDLEDGLTLIEELIQYRTQNNQNFKIIVISSTDDQKIIEKVYTTGANEFIAKSVNWHNEIVKYIANALTVGGSNFSTFVCENNICVYSIKQLHHQEQIDALLQNIQASIYAQKPNIILNLELLKSFNEEFTPMFSEIYKKCQEAGGELVLLSPSKEIETALQNAFLFGLIKIAQSINDAIPIIKNANNYKKKK